MKYTHTQNCLWSCKCIAKARGNIGFIYEATNGTGASHTFESDENLPEHPIFLKLNQDFGFLETWLMPDLSNLKITSSIFIHQEGEVETLEIVINNAILCAGHIINDKSALSFEVLGGLICVYNCL